MYSVFLVILLIGIVMVIDGIYREEIDKLKRHKVVEYKYIPRNMYEDSLYFDPLKSTYKLLFETEHDSRSAGRY